ncbi:hypothetical protein RA210_U10313 [Rubrivivax sp. A210]|nr:hypothetical protein RA210_U10313 [Rubrivivax sp. A210]
MAADVAVAALAALVVKAHHAHAAHGVDATVLVAMRSGRHRLRHTPHHQLDDAALGRHVLEAGDEFGLHVGNCANDLRHWQSRQQPGTCCRPRQAAPTALASRPREGPPRTQRGQQTTMSASTTPDHQAQAQAFIARWSGAGGSERANYQLFIGELCTLLDVPAPGPASGDAGENAYVFERRVGFAHGDGGQSVGFIDCYRRGAFVLEAKKLRAGAGTRGFDEALLRARAQAESYARALPAAEGRPPFVVVVDVGRVIELYAEFTRSGATYTPFPDARSHRLPLARLAEPALRERLRTLWLDPMALDPARQRPGHARGGGQAGAAGARPRGRRPRRRARGRLSDALPVQHVRRGRGPAAPGGQWRRRLRVPAAPVPRRARDPAPDAARAVDRHGPRRLQPGAGQTGAALQRQAVQGLGPGRLCAAAFKAGRRRPAGRGRIELARGGAGHHRHPA